MTEKPDKTPKKKKPRRKRSKTATHYIDNDKFCEHMSAWKDEYVAAVEVGEPKPQLSEYLGDCFVKIATNLAFRPNFINYPYRDEMISDGIENCLMYCHNFDPTKSKNPFSYFTQIIFFAFLRRIATEKKQAFITYECFKRLDERGTFESWAKRTGRVGLNSTDAYADFMKLTSADLEKYTKTKKVKTKKKKTTKKPKAGGDLDSIMGE